MNGAIRRIMSKAYLNVLGNPREAKTILRLQNTFLKSEKRRSAVARESSFSCSSCLSWVRSWVMRPHSAGAIFGLSMAKWEKKWYSFILASYLARLHGDDGTVGRVEHLHAIGKVPGEILLDEEPVDAILVQAGIPVHLSNVYRFRRPKADAGELEGVRPLVIRAPGAQKKDLQISAGLFLCSLRGSNPRHPD